MNLNQAKLYNLLTYEKLELTATLRGDKVIISSECDYTGEVEGVLNLRSQVNELYLQVAMVLEEAVETLLKIKKDPRVSVTLTSFMGEVKFYYDHSVFSLDCSLIVNEDEGSYEWVGGIEPSDVETAPVPLGTTFNTNNLLGLSALDTVHSLLSKMIKTQISMARLSVSGEGSVEETPRLLGSVVKPDAEVNVGLVENLAYLLFAKGYKDIDVSHGVYEDSHEFLFLDTFTDYKLAHVTISKDSIIYEHMWYDLKLVPLSTFSLPTDKKAKVKHLTNTYAFVNIPHAADVHRHFEKQKV